MSRLAVTGASGLIGRRLVAALAARGHKVVGIGRDEQKLAVLPGLDRVFADPHWVYNPVALASAISGCELVFHLADDSERGSDRSTSAELARSLTEAAGRAGVDRLVFSSSIYARLHHEGQPGAYGAGKHQAEEIFRAQDSLTTVVLRLPPVYGAGFNGGVERLARLVRSGVPLPFAWATAARSYLWSENLTSLFTCLADLPQSRFASLAIQPLEPSDGRPIGTRDLVLGIGQVVGRKPRLFRFPRALLLALARPIGMGETIAAAFDSSVAQSRDELRDLTGWAPSADLAANLAYLRAGPI